MRRFTFVVAAAALLLAATAVTGRAQTNVKVTLSNPSPSRTLYVEDMLGAPLTQLSFGKTRSQPFRVRVVDGSMTRDSFSVAATMTNLYVDDSGTIDHSKSIVSSNVSIGSATNPLNVLGVSAAVQPLVDTVSTVADPVICNTLGVVMSLVNGVNACVLSTSGLVGKVQDLAVPVNLSNLANLPLLPQSPEIGAFTNPDYAGVGATDPAKPATWTPTARRMLAGTPVDTATVLTALHAALDSSPVADLVPQSSIVSALQNQFSATWGLLSAAQIDSIVAATTGVAQALVPDNILSQTGTYISLPTLNATVPPGATPGNYLGTLVVTALQP
jgi:hypothetical protein